MHTQDLPYLPENCSWKNSSYAKCLLSTIHEPLSTVMEISKISEISELFLEISTPIQNQNQISDDELQIIGKTY